MPGKLDPPQSLDDQQYFVLQFHRGTERYTLVIRSTAASYDLGTAVAARQYFTRIGMEYLGGRAMDSAFSFGASQALVREGRAFGLDTTKTDLAIHRLDQQLTRDRLLGTPDDDEDEVLLL